MLTDYFRYINFSRSSFPGFYVIQFHNRSYYACAYGDRIRAKMQIIDILKSIKGYSGMRPTDFDFHHLVERPHLADISSSGVTVDESYGSMPTVMVHKSEHNRYNMILRVGETRELYMRKRENLPFGVNASEMAVRKMIAANKEEAKKEINHRITILNDIYRAVYDENEILKIIAGNIFNNYRSRIADL